MPAQSTAAAITTSQAIAQPQTGGMGKYYMIAQGLSALMGIAGGFAGMQAARQESSLLNAQADLALSEAERDARLKREQVLAAREDQAQAYNNSGVLLEGSPLTVLSDTVRKGNMEIAAIEKRGKSMADLYRMKASQTRSAGKSNMLLQILNAGAGMGQAFIMGKKLGTFTTPTASASQNISLQPFGDVIK